MNRLLLINKNISPTRKELTTTERQVGGELFSSQPGLEYAGYIIATNRGRLAAQWIVEDHAVQGLREWISSRTLESHDIELYVSCKNVFGGQSECQVI